MEALGRTTPAQFRDQAKNQVVLVLENVRSALNVGSAFRTADAFALEKIYLCGITATPPHREILKTALGATETVSWEYSGEIASTISTLQSTGYVVYAVEQTTVSHPLNKVKALPMGKYALVFGNEVTGVSEEALSRANGSIEVPQFGTKHSLNIAVCVGIVVWEFVRQMTLDTKR